MARHWDETMLQAAPVARDAGAARGASDETTAGDLHFRELISLLRRRSRLILTIALCGTMLVLAAGLMMPPKYTAKALIAVDLQSSGARPAASSRDEAVIETHITMLLSRDHLRQVVGDLPDGPEFRRAASSVRGLETEGAPDRAPRSPAAARWLPSPSELAHRLKIWTGRFSDNANDTILKIEKLKRRLSVSQEGRSRSIAVRYRSTDPGTAATVANLVTTLYVEGQGEKARVHQRRTGSAR